MMENVVLDSIIHHNNQYYDRTFMDIWKDREILEIDGVYVPQYIYKGTVDPNDHSTAIYRQIMKYENYFRGKKFLDIGCCAGINNILLTRAGYHVEGLDNSVYSLNASLYVMSLNEVYYKVYLGDQNDIEKMDYDVLLVNQMDYIPGFIDTLKPILEREKEKGRMSMMFVRSL